MKFEVEKKDHKTGWIISLCIILILGIVLVVKNSFAKYSSVKTIHLVNGVVNYTSDKENPKINNVDITTTTNSITVVVNATDDKGIKEYYYQIDSNPVIKDTSNAYIFSNLEAGTSYTIKIYVTDIKDKKSEFYTNTVSTKTKSNETLTTLKLSSKGKYNSNDIFTGKATDAETGIYETEDDFGISYYFRGDKNQLKNWVQFAGFYWRIIRINGNGSIRMIYQGVANGNPSSSNKTGTTTQINNRTYSFNNTHNNNLYVGYMYGAIDASSYKATHTNTNNSSIKANLDTWYSNNLSGYTSKLDTEIGFCNDREINNTAYSNYSGTGTANSVTAYAPAGRLLLNGNWNSSQTPTLKCTNKERDLFTVTGTSSGNKKLTYPVGLITSDEVVYAGGFGGTEKTGYYLYTGQQYWTMSPCNYNAYGYATVFHINSKGLLAGENVNNENGIRPVINLKASAITSGNGSESSPFIVS